MFAFASTKVFCAFRIYKEFKMASEGYLPAANADDIDDNYHNAADAGNHM